MTRLMCRFGFVEEFQLHIQFEFTTRLYFLRMLNSNLLTIAF